MPDPESRSMADQMSHAGPKADVPVTGGAGVLPYAGGPRGRRRWAPVALVLVAALALAGGFVVSGDDGTSSEQSGAAPAGSTSTSTAPASSAAPTTQPEPGTTTKPTTTTTKPAASTSTTPAPASATADIAVKDLPRHEAVYRNGKLILQGTVPSAEVRDRYRQEAAAVIGAENVVVRYQIDPRVPVPTDGRVRVDEAFLFDKNSAAIDPRYDDVLQLGVTVMKLNPQARMRITGYTDDSGSDEVNLRLSKDRADALRAALAANGIDASRVDASGKGESDFVAPNDSRANRAKNRRIEVELLNLLAE